MGDTEETDFQSEVKKVVSQIVLNKTKGIFVVPDTIECSEEVKAVANSEVRYRNTQSAYTKKNQELIKERQTGEFLLKKLTKSAKLELSPKQEEELEELRDSDPNVWRTKINSLELQATEQATTLLKAEIDGNIEISKKDIELESRKTLFKEFRSLNPDIKLDDKVIEDNIPPNVIKKLEKGDITFAEFLNKVELYTKTDKVIVDTKVYEIPDLSNVGGGVNVKTPDLKKESTEYNSMIL